jgi:hypothetical protein
MQHWLFYWHLGIVYQSIFKDQAVLEDGTDWLTQKSVSNYHWMVRNMLEVWRPLLHHDRSLKSHTLLIYYYSNMFQSISYGYP